MSERACKTCGVTFRAARLRSTYCSRKCLGIANGRRQMIVRLEGLFSIVEKGDGCWLWPFGKDKDGYGKFHGTRAHRVAYELAVGPIPDGQWVLHSCDNPPCINPAHLFLGDAQINAADMRIKGRAAKGEAVNNAKLTTDAVRHIRAAGTSTLGLARRFGVSKQTIGRARRRQTWAHVP